VSWAVGKRECLTQCQLIRDPTNCLCVDLNACNTLGIGYRFLFWQWVAVYHRSNREKAAIWGNAKPFAARILKLFGKGLRWCLTFQALICPNNVYHV